MRNTIFWLILLVAVVNAATNTWVSATAKNWSDGTAWSLGVKPTTGDDVVFDNTGVGNCTVDETPAAINNLTMNSTYTGNFSLAGYVLTATGNINFSGTGGTLNLGNGITVNGNSATLTIASSVGAVTASACVATLNGTTNVSIVDNKSVTIKEVILGTNSVVTCSGAYGLNVTNSSGSSLVMNSNSTLNLGNKSCRIYCNVATNAIVVNTGCAVNTSAPVYINTEVSLILPPLIINQTAGGYLGIWPQNIGNNVTVTFGGEISAYDIRLRNNGFSNVTINTNNQNITAQGVLYVGSSGGSGTYNFGSSVCTIGSFDGVAYNSGTSNVNLQTSQWVVKGPWANGSNATVVVGSSLVTFTTNSASITTAGKYFYDMTFNNLGANTATLLDNLTCHTLTTSGTGNFNTNSKNITASGDVSFNNTGTLSGSNTTITLTNTSAITASGKLLYNLVFNAPTKTIQTGSALTCNNLKISAGTTILMNAAVDLTISTYNAGDWNGLTLNTIVKSTVNGTRWNLINPTGMSINKTNIQDCNATNRLTASGVNLGTILMWCTKNELNTLPTNDYGEG